MQLTGFDCISRNSTVLAAWVKLMWSEDSNILAYMTKDFSVTKTQKHTTVSNAMMRLMFKYSDTYSQQHWYTSS